MECGIVKEALEVVHGARSLITKALDTISNQSIREAYSQATKLNVASTGILGSTESHLREALRGFEELEKALILLAWRENCLEFKV